jgi:hypothetical protein
MATVGRLRQTCGSESDRNPSCRVCVTSQSVVSVPADTRHRQNSLAHSLHSTPSPGCNLVMLIWVQLGLWAVRLGCPVQTLLCLLLTPFASSPSSEGAKTVAKGWVTLFTRLCMYRCYCNRNAGTFSCAEIRRNKTNEKVMGSRMYWDRLNQRYSAEHNLKLN